VLDVLLVALAAAVGAVPEQVEHDDRPAGVLGQEALEVLTGGVDRHVPS
jgi:hypothetical protein